MIEQSWNWNYPTSVRFGPGRIAELPEACREIGIQNPLLITDPGIASLPILKVALDANREAGIPTAVFSNIQGNPTGQNVTEGVRALRDGTHDGVVAMGGGSALDVAKAVALMADQARPLWDFEDVGDNWTRVNTDGMVPLVAVPTTSGTGSEVGRASVITHEDSATKKIIFHPNMLPAKVICDPSLTIDLPAAITAAVGMDALSHSLEAFCANGNHPQADGIALEGIRLVSEYLLRAVSHPNDIEARSGMMAASLMGATAFQKGLGAMHSMAHVIGAQLHAHHGLINAVVMPYVLLFNRAAISTRLVRLSRYMNLQEPSFESFLNWVLMMRKTLKIPNTLVDLGMRPDHVEPFAAAAMLDPSTGSNPIDMSHESFVDLFRNAHDGVLV